MPKDGHIELSDFIKKVHEELREKSRLLGPEKAWEEHCEDHEKLQKYAVCMNELATIYWEKRNENKKADISRISWVYRESLNYFTEYIFNIRTKELEIALKINEKIDILRDNDSGKLKLLDVGSCYNPFLPFNSFEVTAIDIAPALKTVIKCDFLKVHLDKTFQIQNNEITTLPENYFDIVVFSLILEYFPVPSQRKSCCNKAYNLLKPEGILLIITPDSNHVGSNTKYIKSWRFVLANMGFSRIKYEKLKHVHCMLFRKSLSKQIPVRWADIHKKKQLFDEIYIPQDFKKPDSMLSTSEKFSPQDILELNKELPFCNLVE